MFPTTCGPAPPTAIYPDIPTALAAIQAHARANGYVFFQRDKKPWKVVYACDRAGKPDMKGKNPSTHESKQRKGTGSKKCDCKIRVALRLDKVSSN